MSNNVHPMARPWWVRAVLSERANRGTAQRQRIMFLVVAGLGLTLFALESSSDTVLGAIARPCAVVIAGAALMCGTWASLAIRWVDRNGTWD
jgi:protein-S-isoprenylcysteine O-methyltransferase Ste14